MEDAQLEDMPFDHYARYRLAADVVEETARELRSRDGVIPTLQVLDVGGGPGSLERFVPDHVVTPVDAEPPNAEWYEAAPDLVIADGSDLPFDDNSYDVVVSLDTLEHVPPDRRQAFVAEAARVASEFVLIVCPCDTEGVADSDRALLQVVRQRFGEEFETVGVLREHLEYGHPDPDMVWDALGTAGAAVARFGSGRIDRWLPMMLQFYELMLLDHDPAVHAVQRWYNTYLFGDDLADPAYRQVFLAKMSDARVAITPAALERRIRARHPALLRDDDAFRMLRTVLLDGLESVVSRQQHQLTRLRGQLMTSNTQRDEARQLAAQAEADAAEAARLQDVAEADAAAATAQISALQHERDELADFRDRVVAHPAYRLYRTFRRG